MGLAIVKKNRIALTVILAIVLFVFSIMLYADMSVVKGEDNNTEKVIRNNTNISDLYYFTDCTEGNQLCEQLVQDGNIVNYKIYSWQEGDLEYINFWHRLSVAYTDGEFNNIYDTHIIFDIRYERNFRMLDFGAILKKLFQDFKNQGCQIMFISGLDEQRFKYGNTFLDYVDIHINIDILTTFIMNIFDKAKKSCGSTILENCTFIVDKYFANAPLNSERGWFVDYYLIPYLNAKYSNIFTDQEVVDIVFNRKDIQILYHYGDDKLYDMSGKEYNIYDSNLYYQSIAERNVFAIGCAWNEDEYSCDWISNIISLRECYNSEFPIFLFRASYYDCADYYKKNIYRARTVHFVDFYDIVVDFLYDLDLMPYDNYDGRCIVTHRIRFESPNGWMQDLDSDGIDSEFNMAAWKYYDEEGDYIQRWL